MVVWSWWTIWDHCHKSPAEKAQDSFDLLRQRYIEETIQHRSLEEIEHMIEHTEIALSHSCTQLDRQVQRTNLDLLNTIYVMKCVLPKRALQIRQVY